MDAYDQGMVRFWLTNQPFEERQIVALVNPNMELVSAHKAQASEGLKNPADAQQFSVELREAADPMSADVGLERIYMGSAGPKFVCGDKWDFVWLVRYASP